MSGASPDPESFRLSISSPDKNGARRLLLTPTQCIGLQRATNIPIPPEVNADTLERVVQRLRQARDPTYRDLLADLETILPDLNPSEDLGARGLSEADLERAWQRTTRRRMRASRSKARAKPASNSAATRSSASKSDPA